MLQARLQHPGFPVSENKKLVPATYVDNIFAAATTGNGAVSILNMSEDSLREQWALEIKSDSTEYMVAKGSPHTSSDTIFKQVVKLKALGHTISHDAGCREDWNAARCNMWRAFFRTCTGKAAQGLPERPKSNTLHRVVGPILEYHNSRWAVNRTCWPKSIVYRES